MVPPIQRRFKSEPQRFPLGLNPETVSDPSSRSVKLNVLKAGAGPHSEWHSCADTHTLQVSHGLELPSRNKDPVVEDEEEGGGQEEDKGSRRAHSLSIRLSSLCECGSCCILGLFSGLCSTKIWRNVGSVFKDRD